jgi:hypothetical protein
MLANAMPANVLVSCSIGKNATTIEKITPIAANIS